MRIAFLYTRPSGYLMSCLKKLYEMYGTQILLIHCSASKDAPFKMDNINYIKETLIKGTVNVEKLCSTVREYKPECVYISGWSDRDYLKVGREMKQLGIPVIAGIDAQWRGTARQHAGVWISKYFLHPSIDYLWVPGDRQALFARKLGYGGETTLYGLYSCDWDAFSRGFETKPQSIEEGRFLYIGRYAVEKGVHDLLSAYRLYREMVPVPWALHCIGTGPLKGLLKDQHGVRDLGFIQPDELPEIMSQHGAFILPSHYEPWGVVIHEATASGLPIICSYQCGASSHLVQDGYNGYLFEAGDNEGLAHCLKAIGTKTEKELALMGERSHELSKQFTPERWANTLINSILSFQKKNHHS